LSSPDDLERFGLSLTDFAPHDAAQDLLHVVQAHKGVNQELHELNSKLKVKQRQLIEKELEARKLASILSVYFCRKAAVTISDAIKQTVN
jgi:hypothetical protein